MDQKRLREFTEHFLEHHQCKIIESTPTHLVTQLSIDIDKDLLNRPFYWIYVERMGLPPQPAQLCLIFDPENRPADLSGEYLFFGAPRFKMMLHSAKKHGRFVRLFQETHTRPRFGNSLPYVPWLSVNFKVSYICDQKKERIHHLGINLQSGEISEDFYEELMLFPWTHKMPTGRHLLPEKMPLSEAVSELEYYLEDFIQQEDHSWAVNARKRYENEMEQLESYFPDHDELGEEQQKNKALRNREVIRQYHPRIEVEVVNTGIFYRDMEVSKWGQTIKH
jgi:hypothetical protein